MLCSLTLHDFPIALAEMLLTLENCFSSRMLREKAILNVYFVFEVSIHKRKGRNIIVVFILWRKPQQCTFMQ